MKRYINLLPPEEQRQIEWAKFNALLVQFGVRLVLSFVLLAAGLLATQLLLHGQLDLAESQLAERTAVLRSIENSSLRQDVETFNADLKNFTTLVATGQNWSQVLQEFARALPADLTVDRLTITPAAAGSADLKIEVAGRGGTRAAVLKLRQNLLGSKLFSNVNFPLKNLERATDAPWNYRFYAKQ